MLLYVAMMTTMWAYCANPDLVMVLCSALILGFELLANFFWNG
jgi:hypothetical protein